MTEVWSDGWLPLPPPAQVTVWLRGADGSEALGLRYFDSQLGRSFYWRFADAKPKAVSKLQRAGLVPFRPRAWRPYSTERITLPSEPIARREAEILVHRTILTDGTMQGRRKGRLTAGDLGGCTHLHDAIEPRRQRYVPTRDDVQNYEDGVVMSWFLALPEDDMQTAMVLKAHGFSYHVIGDHIDVSDVRAKLIYRKAVDHVWNRALADRRPVRRLKKEEWATGETGSR